MAQIIRPVRPDDEGAIGEIAFLTGFFGESAARYFPDQRLFADLWVGPYFAGGGSAGFVAEVDGRVLGYVLGSTSHRQYQLALIRVVVSRVLPSLWSRYQKPWAALPYLLRAARFPSPHANEQQFPAHLHINLLPQSRGMGLGEALLRTHLTALGGLHVPGVQLSTTAENRAALGLYRKLGFFRAASQVSPLWEPWLGHPVEHLALALRLPGSTQLPPQQF